MFVATSIYDLVRDLEKAKDNFDQVATEAEPTFLQLITTAGMDRVFEDPKAFVHEASKAILSLCLRHVRAIKFASVAYVVHPQTKKILTVYNTRYQGWGLPGGLVEPHESPYEALVRELGEETGLKMGSAMLMYEAFHGMERKEGRADVVRFYVVRPTDWEAKAQESGCPVGWMTPSEFLAESPFRAFYGRVFEALRISDSTPEVLLPSSFAPAAQVVN